MYWKDILVNFFNENKKLLVLYLIGILILYPLEAILIPKLYGDIFSILSNKNRNIKLIIRYFIYIVLTWLLIQGAYIFNSYTDSNIAPKLNEYTRNYIYKNLLLKYYSNYEDLELGKISAKLLLIPSTLKEFFNDLLTSILPKILICILITIYLFSIDYKIGLLLLFWLIIILISYILNYKRCVEPSTRLYNYFEIISEKIQDKLSNLAQIYANGKMRDEIKENSKDNDAFKKKYNNTLKCLTSIKAINYTINMLIFITINGLTIKLYGDKKITNSQMMTIFIILLYLMTYLIDFTYYTPDIIYYLGLLNENEAFIKSLINHDRTDKPNILIDRGDIMINNISFSYNSKRIFEDLALKIKAKSRVALVGSSGSGKSTLIKLLMGFYKPEVGNILIDGKDIDEYDMDSYRSQISYIHQNTILFNKTIFENISYGKNITRDKVNDLINELKINKIFEKLEKGIDTPVGVNGSNLSGGQRQCIHLLRTLIVNNKILIMDEPMSAIDYENKKLIMEVIEKISKEKTLILITHDLSNLDFMDNVYKIENGKII